MTVVHVEVAIFIWHREFWTGSERGIYADDVDVDGGYGMSELWLCVGLWQWARTDWR